MNDFNKSERDKVWKELVYSDPEFMNDLLTLSKSNPKDYREIISNKYRLPSFNDAEILESDEYKIILKTGDNKVYGWIDESSMKAHLVIDADISKDMFMDAYKLFEAFRLQMKLKGRNITKSTRRVPNDMTLVYAIHKARLNNLTYKQIFQQYKSNIIEGYHITHKAFKFPEELKDYYNKNKPSI